MYLYLQCSLLSNYNYFLCLGSFYTINIHFHCNFCTHFHTTSIRCLNLCKILFHNLNIEAFIYQNLNKLNIHLNFHTLNRHYYTININYCQILNKILSRNYYKAHLLYKFYSLNHKKYHIMYQNQNKQHIKYCHTRNKQLKYYLNPGKIHHDKIYIPHLNYKFYKQNHKNWCNLYLIPNIRHKQYYHKFNNLYYQQ